MSDDVCRHCLGVDPLTWPDGERYPAAAPDRPGDRDQQQAAELWNDPDRWCEDEPADVIAAALADARAEEAARWRAKIERLAVGLLADRYDSGTDHGYGYSDGLTEAADRLRALLDGEQR